MKSYCLRRDLLPDAEGFAGFLIENHPHTADAPKVPSAVLRGCDALPRLKVGGRS